MAIFKYQARNQHGEKLEGKVEANNEAQAMNVLSERSLFVIDIKPLIEDSFFGFFNLFNQVNHTDVVNFTRQLATMINAGLPLATSLSILTEQGKPEMIKVVANLLKEIEGGSPFSAALGKQSKVFSRVYVNLVKAGELGGVLDTVLQRLAETMEKEKEFRSKTQGALVYPIIVMIAMGIVAMIMMIFVVPKLTMMYRDFGAEMPLPTRILMGSSDFFVKYWWVVVFGSVVGGYVFKKWHATHDGQIAMDKFTFKVPIVGILKKKIILTDFARTTALLLGAGVSLLEALDIVADAMNSLIYRETLAKVNKEVEKGLSLSQSIGRYDIFPSILNQMMSVGEETGKMDEVLSKLSKYFESESEQAVKNLTTAIEPLIMIVLGIGVALLVIAVIMPIYSLTSKF